MSDYTSHPEWLALLAAVRAAPTDDLPRLVAADWLDEHAQPERAEFIRVQVGLARRPDCGHAGRLLVMLDGTCGVCPLRRRERELWSQVDLGLNLPDGWSSSLVALLDAESPGVVVRRGFVAEGRCTLADWIGAECHECRGQRVVAGVIRAGATGGALRICPTCSGNGRTPGTGPRVAAAHPVERVGLTDRQPSELRPGKWGYHVVGTRSHVLVNAYWLPTAFKGSGVDGKLFDARDLAITALSAALIAWALAQPAPTT